MIFLCRLQDDVRVHLCSFFQKVSAMAGQSFFQVHPF